MNSPSNKQQKDTGKPGGKPQQGGEQNRDRSSEPQKDQVQGEGNYDAGRAFDEDERKFVESGKVEAAARAAAPRSEAEAQELLEAERKGKSRSKGEDPAITRPQTNNPAAGGADNRKR